MFPQEWIQTLADRPAQQPCALLFRHIGERCPAAQLLPDCGEHLVNQSAAGRGIDAGRGFLQRAGTESDLGRRAQGAGRLQFEYPCTALARLDSAQHGHASVREPLERRALLEHRRSGKGLCPARMRLEYRYALEEWTRQQRRILVELRMAQDELRRRGQQPGQPSLRGL